MTFYKFDYSNFPEVKVILLRDIVDNEINNFFLEWMSIYNYKKDFHMIFDITLLNSPNINYVYRLVKFINNLKKQTPQRLKYSILIINNSSIMRFIMNMAMTLTSPAADLYIYWKKPYEGVSVYNIKDIFMERRLEFQHFSP